MILRKESRAAWEKRLTAASGVLLPLVCAMSAEVLFLPFAAEQGNLAAVGRAAILFLSLYVIHRFALRCFRDYRSNAKDLACLALVLFGSILLIWIGNILALGLSSYAASSKYLKGISPESIYFAIPYASGALLIQSILGLHYGLVFSLSLSLVAGLYVPGDPLFAALVLVTCLVGCLSVQRLRSRSAYVRAGMNICIAALPFALASVIVDQNHASADMAVRMIAPLIGGILCSFIAGGTTPVLEYLGGYVTDMRLLEMATLDHPLLKELSIQAPGTWNHSMVMGMMVEQAADATGANPVLARVSAYFHDIGKMKKPLYFVENQIPGENRHDKLSPSMSALIIKAHVKDGIELSRKHKLPVAIEDMIPQHHGTSLIEYFYDKASKDAEDHPDTIEVDESHYRYPGPKPQTREAGILMLADGIEAAARTLNEPTHDRIQGLVQKMINKAFASGELSECELTLQDLHVIAKCFTRVLTGIYHQRIAYAEPAEKVSVRSIDEESAEDAGEAAAPDPAAARKQRSSADDSKGKEPPKEDLKRLGL